MPQKVIRFKGINRRINEFQTSGECEELINLRPDINGGCHVVRPKKVIDPNVQYDMFYEHAWGNESNDIISVNGVVSWMNADTDTPQTLTDKYEGKVVELSSAGNVLVIYCREDNSQSVYRYKNNKYEEYSVAINPIREAWVDYTGTDAMCSAKKETVEGTDASASLNAAANNAMSAFYSNFQNGLCGAAIIGCTYELEDGSEVWSTAFTIANIARWEGYKPPKEFGDSVIVYGANKVYFRIQLSDAELVGVKSINVYATRPVMQYEYSLDENNEIQQNEIPLSKLNLDGQLMYYQGSLTAKQTSLLLNFGKTQAGERVMEVTSGCVTRIGSSVSYNNRFHYYKSTPNHIIQVPTISQDFSISNDKHSSVPSNAYPAWIAYVKFDEGWKLIDGIYNISDTLPCDFAYPMAGVKQMAFVKGFYADSGEFSVPYNEMFYVNLKNSSAYNYSYAFDVTPEIVGTDRFYEDIESAGQMYGDKIENGFDTTVVLKQESNAINVSAPYNPFAFPVEYSYSFGGEILDITTSYLPISSTQVGQYPLTVFTTNGIYAMEQGDGSVLYSNIVPLQPLVIDGKAKATPYGTFFISSKSLYLLSGREVADLSYILNGRIDERVRDTEAFRMLASNEDGDFHDFWSELSHETFEYFAGSIILNYDQLHNELYLSRKGKSSSYVFNLDTKQYHKVSKSYLESQNGARYIIEVNGSIRNVIDLHQEDDAAQHIFLQSRPIPLEVLYTHIQRAMLFVDANLSANELDGIQHNLCLSIFASDNLHDWKCIISAQKHGTVLRQIRTNKAAKSYKDYVILISGTVPTDTDISDLVADYSVVQRRLG